jgi:putative ABC transport system substrate-binding protein
MQRRAFIVATAALAAPCVAWAQRAGNLYRIGTLGGAPGPRWDSFRDKLRELGWVEGKNIEILSRWSDGATKRIPDFARELVRLEADVIVTEGSIEATAVKRATVLLRADEILR